MAAVFAALACQVTSGDRIVSSDALFGSCQYILADILPKWGVECVFVDGRDNDAWAKALSKPTKAVFLETPSNPSLRLVDLEAVSKLAHAAGATVVVDNVFATPLLQQPLKLGADVVVYSATKHIDGQGRTLGGVILGTNKFITETLQPFLRHTGPSLSPMNAWVLLKGLEDAGTARHPTGGERGRRSRASCPEIRSSRRCSIPRSKASLSANSPSVR